MFNSLAKYIITKFKPDQRQLHCLLSSLPINYRLSQRSMASSNDRYEKEDKFIDDVFNLGMEKAVKAGRDRNNPVIRFKTPEQLKSLINFELTKSGESDSEILSQCSTLLDYSVLAGHPRFFNQQIAGVDSYGLAGNILTDILNVNSITYENAPGIILAEKAVLERILKLFSFENGEGMFCPGGTYSNMLGLHCAKFAKYPQAKDSGLYGLPQLVSFCSEQAHYSAVKNMALLGYGSNNCIKVKCDAAGKMIVSDLEEKVLKAKEEGKIPFFVTAMAGTTVLGSFDPFHSIADLCKKHDMWMHIDGAWGCSAMLSKKHKHYCDGIERADSIAWNPHKMICAPMQCSLLLLREKGLINANKLNAKEESPYNLGGKSLQYGRRSDSLKLWLMWKAKGDEGLEKHVDKAFDNKEYLIQEIKKRPNFRMVIDETECTNIPFWYVPPRMIGQKEDDKFFNELGEIVGIIKTRMQMVGTVLVGHTPVGKTPPFLRMTILNSEVEHSDLDFMLNEVEKYGKDL